MKIEVIGNDPDQGRVFLYYDDDGYLIAGSTEMSQNQMQLLVEIVKHCNCGRECCQ